MKINTPHSARPAQRRDGGGAFSSAKGWRSNLASIRRWDGVWMVRQQVRNGAIRLTENGKRRMERNR
jgi:hypothetical protein